MAAMPVLPCPVRLGVVKDVGLAEQLHKYTLEKNLDKVEKLLKKGLNVDSVNNRGQTPLFCASLLGLTTVVELLLRYGADPNHRCEDRSTPVHAAVFSCKPWLLSGVLDAGGDLRLHDHKGHTPQDWVKAGAQKHSQRMMDFLNRCMSHMHSLSQPLQPQDNRRTPSSSRTLLRSPSLLEFLWTGVSDLHKNRKPSAKSPLFDAIQCFGFGKLCIICLSQFFVDKPRQALGLVASLPFIADRELGHADDEPMVTYTCESFIKMTNYCWMGCRVTVKELQSHDTLQQVSHVDYVDLLISEQEYCCQLYHPHLLQLLAVSMSADLQRIRLVFERVHVASLHTLLHHRQGQYPSLQVEGVLSMLLQVSEALLYLHGRGLVMRSLSSHAVQIVHPGVAKITGLGFTVPSSESGGSSSPSSLPLPHGLYNWAAPEAIRNTGCTEKADLYSLCALIQELFTDAVPWGEVDPRWIRQAVESDQALTADRSLPLPYYQLVRAGLQPRAQDRSSSLQDLRYLLLCDLRELALGEGRTWSGLGSDAAGTVHCCAQQMQSRDYGQKAYSDLTSSPDTGLFAVREKERAHCSEQSDSMAAQEIEAQLNQSDQLLHMQEEVEAQTTSDQSSLLTTFCETPLSLDRETELVSEVVLNLKVSQVLVQQAESSLQAVEAALGEGGKVGGFDEVDRVGVNQPDGRRREPGREQALLAHAPFRAMGPPSRSYLPWQGAYQGAETPQGRIEAGLPSFGEELSFYISAQEESFLDACPRHAQAERSIVSTGVMERREQQFSCSEGFKDSCRTHLLSTTEYSPDGSPQLGWSGKATATKWTSEVSEAVARMTRGRFGAAPYPGSSDSEDADRKLQAGGQDPLSYSGPRGPEDELHNVDTGHSSSEMELLFKSFAGIQSDSDRDSDFHTVNRTMNMTCAAWEATGQNKEADTSDSDYAQSPEGSFYTLNPEPQSHSAGICSQTLSSEEDLEVTMEVCQPATGLAVEPDQEGLCMAAAVNHPVNMDLQRSSHSPQTYEAIHHSGSSHAHMEVSTLTQATAGQHAALIAASGLPVTAELAELSSITYSPAQHEWMGQSSLPSPPGERPAPCNSTPRSPVAASCLKPLNICAEALPHLPSLLEELPWSNTHAQPLSSETFATAILRDSSTTEPSESSVLKSSTLGSSQKQKVSPPTGPPEGTEANRAEREATSAPWNQGTTHHSDGAPASWGTAEADGSQGGAEVVTASVEWGQSATEEGESECSEHSRGDSERTNTPAEPQFNSTHTRGGAEISARERVMAEDKEIPEGQISEREISGKGGPELEEGFGSGTPGENDQKTTPSPEDQCKIEETLRAHSTLDEDLQGLKLEMATSQRFLESPGAIELLRAPDRLSSEKTSHPAGDTKGASPYQRK
ncbi:hypothetical protein GJAV_G00131630 [Gymnothorax javanicus]|nr:hypothetical protein GJAV_G00131630 [Gymnothorax javanicus]